ncbi:MAG: Yip1 family protein [Rhodanobacter sp.]
MDSGKIIDRVKNILTSPKTEWPVATAEPATVQGLYAGYIAIVSALPIIASFIKSSLIGTSAFGITIRTPIGMGIVGMVLHYVLALVLVYVIALIINALAPTFGGQKNMVQSLKTVAYAWTASWIAGIAIIVPWLGWLIALAGAVYAIYLLYLGLPHTMKCPVDKAAGYTAVSVIIAIVLSWIVSLILGMALFGAMGSTAMSGMHTSTSSTVTIDNNTTLGQLAAMGQRAEQASKELEAAQKSGDRDAQSVALGKMMGTMSGSKGSIEALAPDQIKAFLPDSLDGFKRTSISAQRHGAMGMQVADASADYSGEHDQQITLEVSDTGGAKGLMAMASAMAPEAEKETDHGYEKTYKSDGNLVHEEWDNQPKSGEYSVVVGQRFTVKAHGNVDSIDQLKKAVGSVDLRKLESMKDSGVKSH